MDKKILIVDDEKNIRDIIIYNLKKEGYQILQAADGEEGVRLAMEEEPDLILLDIMMPKMDGYDACKKIRETKNTPIIMLTARTDERDELQGFQLGVDEYISKPFSPKILVARIEAILRRTNQTAREAVLSCGGISLDKAAHLVMIDGETVELIRNSNFWPILWRIRA